MINEKDSHLATLFGVIAGLQTMHPDPTVNLSGKILNMHLAGLLVELLGEEKGLALIDTTVKAIAPRLEQFGMTAVSGKVAHEARKTTKDLLQGLRAKGLL
jgi:small basic protein